MRVLEPFQVFMFMFPLSYKHPKGQVDLHCVFMKPHIHSSTCDRKVASGEEPSGAELDLKQVPEGWRWVIVRWWRCCAIWSSLNFCVCCVCAGLCLVSFSIWNFLFCLCCGEMLLILRGSVPVLLDLWSSSCSPFLVELTVPSFPLPITSSYFIIAQTLSSWLSLPSLPDHDLLEQAVYIWLILGLP